MNTAVNGLVEKTDFTELESAVEEARDMNTSKYTEESAAALEEAIAEAEKVLANEDATQEEVDAALAALNAAVEGLTEKAETPVEPVEPQTPSTGDHSMMAVYAGMLMISLIAVFFVIKRKKELN